MEFGVFPGKRFLPSPSRVLLARSALRSLACYRRSDSGASEKDAGKWTDGRLAFPIRAFPHYLNAWNRLCVPQHRAPCIAQALATQAILRKTGIFLK